MVARLLQLTHHMFSTVPEILAASHRVRLSIALQDILTQSDYPGDTANRNLVQPYAYSIYCYHSQNAQSKEYLWSDLAEKSFQIHIGYLRSIIHLITAPRATRIAIDATAFLSRCIMPDFIASLAPLW